MKIAIPVSGGLDSAVLLAETLRNTDHKVAVVHVAERNVRDRGGSAWERDIEAMRKIVEWCEREIRPVVAVIEAPLVNRTGLGGPIRDDLEVSYRDPDAPFKHAMYVNSLVYASVGSAIDRLHPDEAWLGMHNWNYRGGASAPGMSLNSLAGHTDVRIRSPFMTHSVSPGEWWGPGRMAQYRRLPKPLVPVVFGCRSPVDGERCGKCDACATEPFYERFCATVDETELARIEALIERDGMLGRWYADADPQTFRRHDIFDLLRDHDYWERLLACETDAEADQVRDAKKAELRKFNAPRYAA